MKKYFKRPGDSIDGIAVFYLETEDNHVLRQVEVCAERLFWSDRQTQSNIKHRVCDQPFSVLGLTPNDEITSQEFEFVWDRAKRKPQ
jgi:hypothetical protein